MNNIRMTMLSLAIITAVGHQACADPLQINITGNVIASPCTVDTANTDLTVNLGDIQASDLAAAGSYGGTAQTFTLSLKDCPATTTKVTATFSGQPYANDNTLFASTGTANGVGVKIKPDSAPWTDTTVNPNMSAWLLPVSAATHTASFVFAARVFTSVGNVSPGTIISAMQVSFTYQ